MKESLIRSITAAFTGRDTNLFATDLDRYDGQIRELVSGNTALVIGGAGSIGSSYIRHLVRYDLAHLIVLDINENGLAELVRDLRSRGHQLQISAYPMRYSDSAAQRLLDDHPEIAIVANFAAHKHVRSEKDEVSIQAMFENNFLFPARLLRDLRAHPPARFFSVSTDKAANPVSVMGATKKLMEDVILAEQSNFNVSTARFANVAFSNGSLLESFIRRVERNQPIVCPRDVKRYFVSLDESGALCLLANLCGESGDIFYPKLDMSSDLIPISNSLDAFLNALNLTPIIASDEREARELCHRLDLSKEYPVYYFDTDTSGEKPYEEFFTESDQRVTDAFHALGIIRNPLHIQPSDIDEMIANAESIFSRSTQKSDLIGFLKQYLPRFDHIEHNRNLDQKM